MTLADPSLWCEQSSPRGELSTTGGPPAVEVVVPVYNEQHVLAANVHALHEQLARRLPVSSVITIANNASTDSTLAVALALRCELAGVRVLHLEQKGRGRALRRAWDLSEADVVAYTDVDLSSDLAALPELLLPLLQGRADIAIGSRLAPGATVTRGLRRELISRGYNGMLHALLGTCFSDAQCGFKAGRRETIQALLADVEDEAWFFDTELLYLAERRGLHIHEVPVSWVEDRDSRVDIIATAWEDVRGVMRLRRAARAGGAPSQQRHRDRSPASAQLASHSSARS